MKVDLLIVNAGQVVTCAAPGGPKRGKEMTDVEVVERILQAKKEYETRSKA